MRKLKFHEQKLLKKVDFYSWKIDNNLREIRVLRKYHIQKREDYTKYVRLVFYVGVVKARVWEWKGVAMCQIMHTTILCAIARGCVCVCMHA